MRGPDVDPRRVIYRRFSPTRLVTGLAAIAIGAGIQVVVGPWRGHVSARSLFAMALGLFGAAVGLTLVLRPGADFCTRCAARLVPDGLRNTPDTILRATEALRAGDPAQALQVAGAQIPDGEWITVWYCPDCRGTIVWGNGKTRVIATGGEPIVAAMTRGRKG